MSPASLYPDPSARPAASLLREGREHERAGRMVEALASYDAAAAAAESAERPVRAEALRRLGVVHHRQNRPTDAHQCCRDSYEVALEIGDQALAGEAKNALAGFAYEAGDLLAAGETWREALELGAADQALRGRIEANLGILANIHGDDGAAFGHYRRALGAFTHAGDERGAANCYHNLGMLYSDRGLLAEAETHYARSLEIAVSIGDVHLQGLCTLNRSEVLVQEQRYGEALEGAETALCIFERLGARMDKGGAYKVLGMVFRDTGRPVLAEERLRAAIVTATETGSLLSEAEASRELARLYQGLGRNRDALGLLNSAYRLFGRLDARVELVDVARKMSDLQGTFFAVVREWGQSIESADHYTHGHCERVAQYAAAVARALGLDQMQHTTIRLGAYLHDVGKVRVPHEILNKPGRLTPEEFEVMQQHTVYGVELLRDIDFPWDIKPIIRWHHEKQDGTGYPDRLRGDEIPIGAQIIGIVDVFDALTTTRSYRGAMTREAALAELERVRPWWRSDVYDAFMRSVGAPDWSEALPAAA